MKKIGLLSDTHSYWDDKFLTYFESCDEIWHAGDIGTLELAYKLNSIKPLRAVYGNIDGQEVRAVYPEFLRFCIEGVDVLITHIGGYPGKYIPVVKNILETHPPSLFICGHSHILKVMYDSKYKCLDINPGAAGKFGFHKVRTIVRFVIEGGNIQDLEVIELAN